jgi:basic membrane lipoprotein Med (substrate-binding protein (PBP1-ABC) superfamily)
VAAVFDTFVKENQWNETAYSGLLEAKEIYKDRIEIAFVEKISLADYEKEARSFAAAGYDLIFVHATPAGEAAKAVARDYPQTWIVWTDGWPPIEKNMVVITPLAHEASYLAGILAGRMTETNKIGVVGGMNVPSTYRSYYAFERGVKAVNPDAEVKVTWVGTFIDIGAGYDAAKAHIAWGADIICGNGDSQNVGARTASLAAVVYYIGGVGNEHPYAPSITLASVGWGIEKAYVDIIGKALEGELEPEKFYEYGLKEGADLIWGRREVIPEEVQAEVESIRQQILDGTLEVPRKDFP